MCLCPLFRLGLSVLALALSFPAQHLLAQSATTTPVGFIKFSPAPSTDGTNRKFTVGSFPLQGAAVWAGQVNAEPGTNSLVGKSASWTGLGPGAGGAFTHVVRFTGGASVGRVFPISALTNATTVTLLLPSTITNLGTVVDADDTFEVLPVNTLKGLFGATTEAVKFQENEDQSLADLIYLWNGSSWVAYWFDQTKWIREGAEFTDSGTTPIFSDEAVWVARRSTGTIEYSMTGTVPGTASLAIELPGTSTSTRSFTFMANPFPTDTTLGALGLTSLTSWLKNEDQSQADIVYLWNGASWVAYWHDGGKWIREGAEFTDGGPTAIPTGSGVWVSRRSYAPTPQSVYLNITRPYTL